MQAKQRLTMLWRVSICTSLMVLVPLMSVLTACAWTQPRDVPVPPTPVAMRSAPLTSDHRDLLQESWVAYRDRFIQKDGRVIDWESDQRTTSEGQAYALLRAVFADDPKSFQQVLNWAEANLARKNPTSNQLADRLWTWKWGRNPQNKWGVIDGNFASDADIDACYALILAAKRWNKSEYLTLAQQKLQDLWRFSTIEVQGGRYLLPGPTAAFQRADVVTLNPSYLAPYAFRLFAEVDGQRPWLSLVDSSYRILEGSAALSAVGLPSDWVGLETKTGRYVAVSGPVLSQYSFDASRVWWRVALDAEIYQEPRAQAYLQQQTAHIQKLWQQQQKIPAQIDLQGNALVEYDATSQYGMLYIAFRRVNPELAQQIYERKLTPRYRDGFWDNNNAYYTQNLVWFGLLSPQAIAQALEKGQFNLSARPGHDTSRYNL
jgi:endoglucanase